MYYITSTAVWCNGNAIDMYSGGRSLLNLYLEIRNFLILDYPFIWRDMHLEESRLPTL
jgi:hypothetical protein